MTDRWYILDGKTPRAVSDLKEWAQWSASHDRQVAQDVIGDVRISTVFLGLDHNHFGGEPLLFETMIFGGEHSEYQTRCSTWEQAEKMHAAALALVRKGMH